MILGACGSSTSAVIRTVGLIDCEHATVFGGTGARVVGTTPYADSSLCCDGPGGADGADDTAVVRSVTGDRHPVAGADARGQQAGQRERHPSESVHQSFAKARANSRSKSTYGLPETSTFTCAMVPPVNGNGAL